MNLRKFYLMMKTAETMVYAGSWETVMAAMDAPQTMEAAKGCMELKENLKKGEIDKATYEEKTKQLKMGVPVLLPHYQRKDNAGKGQLMDDGEWSDLYYYDIDDDHVKADAKAYYEQWIKGHEAEWGIVMVIISLRGGLHLLGLKPDGMSVEEAQAWLHKQIGDEETKYDASCKDLRRRMILSPGDYLLYVDEEGLTHQISQMGSDPVCENVLKAAMEKAGVGEKDLTEQGARHASLLKILSLGIARTMERAELEEALEAIAPEYMKESDAKGLLDDFYGKYLDDTPCQIDGFDGDGEPLETGGKAARKGRDYGSKATGSKDDEAEEPAFTARRTDYDHPVILRPTAKTQLPDGVRQCLSSVTSAKLWIPEFLAVMTVCGANIPQVTSRDPMGYVHPSLLDLIIWAESGAGKSEIIRPLNFLMVPMREDDALARDKRKKHRELTKSRKSTTALPAAPTDPICELPLDSTPAARAERAELAEPSKRILLTLSDEGGVILSSAEKFESYQLWYNAGWAEEHIQIARSTADSVEAFVNARLSCVMACQPVYRRVIAQTILQGMASRFMNVILEKPVGPLVPLKPVAKKDEQAIIDFMRRLRALPEQELDLPKLRTAMKRWEEDTVKKAVASGDLVLQDDGIRGRIMTSCYRLGVVLTCCWMVDPKAGKKGGDSQLVIDQCLLCADYLADTFTVLFGRDVRRLKSGKYDLQPVGSGTSMAVLTNDQVLEQMPEEFTRDELLSKLPKKLKASSLRSLISRWVKAGKVEKTDSGLKKKTA